VLKALSRDVVGSADAPERIADAAPSAHGPNLPSGDEIYSPAHRSMDTRVLGLSANERRTAESEGAPEKKLAAESLSLTLSLSKRISRQRQYDKFLRRHW
jgi:hypothetical protein